MCSILLKVRTCLKSSQLPSSVHLFCTREFKQYLGGRWLDRGDSNKSGGQGGLRIKDRQGTYDGFSKTSTVRMVPPFVKSVFAAGRAKRAAERCKRKGPLDIVDEEEPARRSRENAEKFLPPLPDRPLSLAEWRDVKESLGNQQRFESKMMIAVFTYGSNIDVAKSLLNFLVVETGTVSYKVLLRYLHACVRLGYDDEVFEVYNIMRGCYSSMETGAFSLFIQSFSRTERWKEALNLFQEVKKISDPSLRNYGDIIAAALQHGDMTTAWAFYDEMIETGKSPLPCTWEVLCAGPKKTNKGDVVQETEQQKWLQGLLLHMRNNQIYPQLSTASKIKTWFESFAEQNWTGAWTDVNTRGKCSYCGSELESIHLSVEEYRKVKDSVMVNIIQGKNVFKKTTPEELERFKEFVEKKQAFDVVIDGLNVANVHRNRRRQSAMLLEVVKALSYQGMNILILARRHILDHCRHWDKHDMSLIQKTAHCFFTEDISKDDPFLLYATLNSGNHCLFLSSDLMRDHKACLPDVHTKRLFFKWQRGHQLVLHYQNVGNRIYFQNIPRYDTIVQTTGDSWHIPYDDDKVERSTHEVPQRWLCLTNKKNL